MDGPLTRRQKRVMAGVGGAALLAIAGLCVWGVSDTGTYGESHAGCVTVTIPSSTGAAQIHACGGRARTMCADAATHDDPLSRLARKQCRLAGVG
jgi:hypothetical protein